MYPSVFLNFCYIPFYFLPPLFFFSLYFPRWHPDVCTSPQFPFIPHYSLHVSLLSQIGLPVMSLCSFSSTKEEHNLCHFLLPNVTLRPYISLFSLLSIPSFLYGHFPPYFSPFPQFFFVPFPFLPFPYVPIFPYSSHALYLIHSCMFVSIPPISLISLYVQD